MDKRNARETLPVSYVPKGPTMPVAGAFFLSLVPDTFSP